MKNYVKSDPVFFRLIKQSMAAIIIVVVVFAALFPAPLLDPADVSRVPNPSRAAWFLIWMQELVSYSKYAIYPIILLGGVFCVLPWLPKMGPSEQARWFPADQKIINLATVLSFLVIVALTVVAFYFRGENWSFGWFF